jgi:hypothetical protein
MANVIDIGESQRAALRRCGDIPFKRVSKTTLPIPGATFHNE